MISMTSSPAPRNPQSEIDKVLPNTLYLSLNAPKVDDYHRALFITHPPPPSLKNPLTSGTLFHATYIDSIWHLEKRSVSNFASSDTLVLLWRICTLTGSAEEIKQQLERIEEVLDEVPLGLAEGEEKRGNPELGGYDCVIWTRDALRKLVEEGVVVLRGAKDIDQIMAEARAAAGPEDARTMVGKDFGGLGIVNDTF